MQQEATTIPVIYEEKGYGGRAWNGLGEEHTLSSFSSSQLRARTCNRNVLTEESGISRAWQRRMRISVSSWKLWILFVAVVAAAILAWFIFPVDKILQDFLIWIHKDLGPWGPVMLALAYIPLTLLAVPACIVTIGGGYLFGLPIGFLADSVGATLGATAAFLVGKTVGRAFVVAKLKEYPQFQAAALAIQRSGFKIVLLLRLVPLLPFNILNYLLSVTPVNIWEYIIATWIGMAPITFALVYVGTTIKDLSDVNHGFPIARWVWFSTTLAVSVLFMVIVTKVAKNSLTKAMYESEAAVLPLEAAVGTNLSLDLYQPLVIKVDSVNIDG